MRLIRVCSARSLIKKGHALGATDFSGPPSLQNGWLGDAVMPSAGACQPRDAGIPEREPMRRITKFAESMAVGVAGADP